MDQITSLRRAVNEMWSGIFHCPNEPIGGLPPLNIPSLRQAPAESSGCPLKCMIKAGVFVLLTVFVLYLPLGDPYTHCMKPYRMYGKHLAMCSICDLYLVSTEVACKSLEVSGEIYKTVSKLLYESKLKFYSLLDTIDRDDLCRAICCSDSTTSLDLGTKKERRACKCMKKCRLKSATSN